MKISDLLAILSVFSLAACSALGSASSGTEDRELVENGYIAISAGDYRTAEILLDRALVINSRNPFTWLNLGVVYQDTHRYDKARQAYKTVIELNPSQTAEVSQADGFAGKSLADIARINLENLPPPALGAAGSGSARDTDQDGVPDDADQCGNTPDGAAVGANGCWALVDVFESGKFRIRPEAEGRLEAVITILKENPEMRLEVQGYTDDRGAMEMNQRLSEERARSVTEYLTRKGIPEDRMQWAGYGQSRPAVSNETADGRRQNRRVELVPIP
jgi:flagellar motor protein MotB